MVSIIVSLSNSSFASLSFLAIFYHLIENFSFGVYRVPIHIEKLPFWSIPEDENATFTLKK